VKLGGEAMSEAQGNLLLLGMPLWFWRWNFLSLGPINILLLEVASL